MSVAFANRFLFQGVSADAL